jgi:signal transduction histidine kinase
MGNAGQGKQPMASGSLWRPAVKAAAIEQEGTAVNSARKRVPHGLSPMSTFGKVGLMVVFLIAAIIGNAIYAIMKENDNHSKQMAVRLDTKLQVACSLLDNEREKLQIIAGSIRERGHLFTEYLDYDNINPITVMLKELVFIHPRTVHTVFLFDEDGVLLTTNHGIPEDRRNPAFASLLGEPVERTGIETLPGRLPLPEGAWPSMTESPGRHIGFKSVVKILHDTGEIYCWFVLVNPISANGHLAGKITRITKAEILILDGDGQTALSSLDSRGVTFFGKAAFQHGGKPYRARSRDVEDYHGRTVATVMAALGTAPFLFHARMSMASHLVPFFISVCVSLLLFWLLKNRVFRPIDRLMGALRAVGEGHLDVRLSLPEKKGSPYRPDEVGRMIMDFNTMVDHLEKTYGQLVKAQTEMKTVNLDLAEANQQLQTEMRRRTMAEERLQETNQNLEQRVKERTAELEKILAELKNTQSQLIQSEKMASIGQLAAGVAHEINNPVGFVKSNLGTLQEYHDDIMDLLADYRAVEALLDTTDPIDSAELTPLLSALRIKREAVDLDFIAQDCRSVVEDSLDGLDRVEKIVTDLKNFSHMDKAQLEYADINAGIESTLNIVKNEIRHKAEIVRDLGDLPQVRCYPQRLNQVFMNLLVNAGHAVEKGGRIHIRTRMVDGRAEIRISDNGCGIPEEIRSRIFDPFYTTRDVGKGTGLGLNVAYNIIESHGGSIEVESAVGEGTTFVIRLDVEPALLPDAGGGVHLQQRNPGRSPMTTTRGNHS